MGNWLPAQMLEYSVWGLSFLGTLGAYPFYLTSNSVLLTRRIPPIFLNSDLAEQSVYGVIPSGTALSVSDLLYLVAVTMPPPRRRRILRPGDDLEADRIREEEVGRPC